MFGHCLITKRKSIFQCLKLAQSLGMAAYSGWQPELQLKRRCAELTNAQHIQAATQTCERVKDGGVVYAAGAGIFS